jgi:CRISPR-associated endonuclease/helicase Cas3
MKEYFMGERYEELLHILTEEYLPYLSEEGKYIQRKYGRRVKLELQKCYPTTKREEVYLYTYARLLFSLLIASDYYAATEYREKFYVETHGSIETKEQIRFCYETSELVQSIRSYQQQKEEQDREMQWGNGDKLIWKDKTMNELRSELFLESENELIRNKGESIFYLEAPTGSGKSITAFNLSIHLMELCPEIKKVWYIYPFNTLVEQNRNIIETLFSKEEAIMKQIKVVNSVTQIGKTKSSLEVLNEKEEDLNYYVKTLLDHQFFHYPITLSTHVTLFDILFGRYKESMFPFYQMANSVIVMDEIQSYRNKIWTEIIIFLKEFASLLNMKIIIMSATLPNLDLLSKEQTKAITLIKNRDAYFHHPLFKNRVEICYELLQYNKDYIYEKISELIMEYLQKGKHILIEFLEKTIAGDFYQDFVSKVEGAYQIELMTGDDNSIERSRVLQVLENTPKGVGCLLVATQVIEAGVDLKTMEIGFKDTSMLDAEEQFMGRINRSCDRGGKVYFFDLSSPKNIYKEEFRVEKQFMLPKEDMKVILSNKNFGAYYEEIFYHILRENQKMDYEKNIEDFFTKVGKLDFQAVSEWMYLIKDEKREIPVFLARKIKQMDGTTLDGREIWQAYETILADKELGYAEKEVKLHNIKSQMNYFIYKIRNDISISYNKQIGEIYYIEDGEQYFKNLKLNRHLILCQNEVFI